MPDSPVDPGLLRLLDAAANRAREGLRVLEDIARFLWDDRELTEACKALRHECTYVLQQLEQVTGGWLSVRDTTGDVGTGLSTATESQRSDVAILVRANAARTQEALRSLEEVSKLFDPEIGAAFKQLRYRSYTLESACLAQLDGVAPLTREAFDE